MSDWIHNLTLQLPLRYYREICVGLWSSLVTKLIEILVILRKRSLDTYMIYFERGYKWSIIVDTLVHILVVKKLEGLVMCLIHILQLVQCISVLHVSITLLQAHVVSAFEQSLSNMTQRLQQLTATAERKVRHIS